MAKGKKIKLQKRSTPLTRTRAGLSLPEGAGNSGYIGFQNAQDLKEKYFVRTGRLGRVPFALRMFVLFVAQFMFTFILYNRIVEGIILGQLWICALFGILLILFTVPTVMSQISLGIRRCRDTGRSGAYFIFPYICYCGGFVFPILGFHGATTMAWVAAFILYAVLALMKSAPDGR